MARRTPIPDRTDADWARFMAKVVPNRVTGCWEWTGGKFAKGYGYFMLAGQPRRAHRVIYVWTNGELAEDMNLDHLCRNRSCVNPAHMEPVTIRENSQRSPLTFQGKNVRKTHCVNGHPLSGDNLGTRRYGKGYIGRRCLTCNRETYRRWAAKKATAVG